ncbi:MAG: hypothetical protein ABJD11_11130 [Gemmatimonadota bacterium]
MPGALIGLVLVLGMKGTSVVASVPTYQKCLDELPKMSILRHSTTEHFPTSNADLVVFPHSESAKKHRFDKLSGNQKWLGAIQSQNGKADDPHRVSANPDTPTCIYFNGSSAGDKGLVLLIGPTTVDTVSRVIYICETGEDKNAHAAWAKEGGCLKTHSLDKDGFHPNVPIPEETLEDGRAAWVSCATNGCCRIQT